jgi:2-phospho-L-lactate guanylyltransferase
MNLWAIVPVKPLGQAKSRLAEALVPEQRATLVQDLLARTIATLRRVPAVSQIVVVTGDAGVETWSLEAGLRVVPERGEPNLNRALEAATEMASAQGAQAVLIVHADLPRVTSEELQAMAGVLDDSPLVVVAPDRHGRGTNALLCAPPGLIEYRFGEGSFALHCAQAQAVSARLVVHSAPGLALDIDYPEDLDVLRAASEAPPVPPGREP